MSNEDVSKNFDNPLDTILSASSRFAIEIIAWIAGPWAAADISGTWFVTIPVLAVLLALPSVFSTVGDKRHIVVAVPGRVRFFIEVLLALVAIISALLVWTIIGAILVAIVAALMFITSIKRIKWLIANSPADWLLPSK
ncbi:MAG: hypothetical protein HQ477_03030 [Chloroflexi bacterium]|nr:hypothetical protein [Chloroflexota bacterium]